jgi:ornithine carbamoyltransferase
VRHLLSIEDLDRAAIERICDRAASFAEVADREIKKVPALRGRTVLNLFYEASTRTRSSFELAAKRLSADVVNFSASGSSVEKGESLKDTVLTLNAHKPDAIVIRAPWAGAPALVAQWTPAAIINAGDGKHEHPTQALLDVHTLRQRLGGLDGLSIWIVGDVLHSRVARSNILAFQKMGARVTGLRAADAHPARRRGARLRRALHPRRPGRGRRRLRPAHAARAHGPGLRADPARVRQRVPDQRPPAAPAPGAHAPRARSTAGSSSPARSSTRRRP